MTNEQIIFSNQLQLMEQGKIKGTGRAIEILLQDGTTKQIEEPEQIHTFKEWEKLGFKIRKGEKSIARFSIWMFKTKKKQEEQEQQEQEENTITIQVKSNSDFYMKESCFFSASQVERLAI